MAVSGSKFKVLGTSDWPPKAFPELRATSASSQVLAFLRELAEKMRAVLAYDPAMAIRANEVACAADAIDEWAKGLR